MNKTGHPIYGSWRGMNSRCYGKTDGSYHLYGGLGVSVCDRWRGDFWSFVSDMGPKPSQAHSIDRIDPFGDYEPGNCRWATPKEQAANKRVRVSRFKIGDERPCATCGVTHVMRYEHNSYCNACRKKMTNAYRKVVCGVEICWWCDELYEITFANKYAKARRSSCCSSECARQYRASSRVLDDGWGGWSPRRVSVPELIDAGTARGE